MQKSPREDWLFNEEKRNSWNIIIRETGKRYRNNTSGTRVVRKQGSSEAFRSDKIHSVPRFEYPRHVYVARNFRDPDPPPDSIIFQAGSELRVPAISLIVTYFTNYR